MNIFLALFISSVFFLFVRKMERTKFGCDLFTPFNLLYLPVGILILMSFIQEHFIGYYASNAKGVFIILYTAVFFWLGGLLYMSFNKKNKYSEWKENIIPTKLFNVISCAFIFILIINFNSILGNRSILLLEDQEFAQNGIEGHIGELIVFFIIYYLSSFKERAFHTSKMFAISISVIMIFLKIAIAIKAQAVIPFVATLLYLAMRGLIKVNYKSIIIGIIGIVLLFLIPAAFFNTHGDTSTAYLSSYLVFYLYAGISGLTGFLITYPTFKPGGNPEFLIRFFQNFVSKFFGDGTIQKGGVAPGYVEIFTDKVQFEHSSNVCTAFGEIYLNCGPVITAFYYLVLGFVMYHFYHHRKKHFILGILYAYIGSMLVMSFFSAYTLSQTFYETSLFIYFLYVISVKWKKI